MRLKVMPDDFRVREQLSYPDVRDGAYFVHLLRKEKLDTQQALSRVARLAGVRREDLAFAGLKDRQGQTEQWISIRGRMLEHSGKDLSVSFKGRTDRPLSSRLSSGNHFEIVVRDLSDRDVDLIERNAELVVRDGLPNYFDDQRFGNLRHGQGFVMRDILRGDYEAALRALLAQPSPKAITGDVKLKRILAEHWGRWEVCSQVARGPVYQRVFGLLCERGDAFREALESLPARSKLIHAFAYQSGLWNHAVDRMLMGMLPRRGRVSLTTRVGRHAAWHFSQPGESMSRLARLITPLYGPEGEGGDAEFRAAAAEILREEGFEAGDFWRHRVKGMVLREEPRALVVRPEKFELSESARDEIHRGRRKVRLAFGLPRGSYATMVVKRLTASPSSGSTHRRAR